MQTVNSQQRKVMEKNVMTSVRTSKVSQPVVLVPCIERKQSDHEGGAEMKHKGLTTALNPHSPMLLKEGDVFNLVYFLTSLVCY